MFSEETQTWALEETLKGHTDWVRDGAWAPNVGIGRSYIASASQVCSVGLRVGGHRLIIHFKDRTVLIWTKDSLQAPWVKNALDPSTSTSAAPTTSPTAPAQPGKFPDVVWRVSWSLAGNVLAVSCGDGKVTLWKENLKGVWECVNDLAS